MDVKQLLARVAKADFADAVGLAITHDFVAAAHVRKRLHAVSVQALASRTVDVPPEGRTAFVVGFLRDFIEQRGLEEARLSVALEQRDIMLGRLPLPATAVENFASVVRYELDRIFPMPADALLTDQYWRPLGATGERVHATIVAAVRERVEQLQRELAAAGLSPTAVTALPVALNDFYRFCRDADRRTAGIFYADGERTTMTVSSRGLMVSSVHVDPEAESPNERLWRELETLVPDAIQDDIEVVIDGQGSDGAVPLASIAPPSLFDDLIAEGGAALRWPEAAAIGAALGQVGEAKTRVNLLPAELVRAEEGIGLRELGLSAAVILLALVLGGAIALKDLSISGALAAEIDRLLPRVSSVQKQEANNRAVLEKLKVLERHRHTSVLSYLRAMTERVPTTAYLTTFRFKGDRVEVDGIATTASELISTLERSPYFKNVEFTAPTTKYLQNQERFSLRMGLEQ